MARTPVRAICVFGARPGHDQAVRSLVLVLVFVALLGIAGCKRGGPDCARAAANAMKVSEQGLAQIPGMNSRLGPMQAALANRCDVDRWSSEVIDCISTATTTPALQACQDRLTPDQQTLLRRTMMEMIGVGGGGGSGGGGPATLPAPTAPDAGDRP